MINRVKSTLFILAAAFFIVSCENNSLQQSSVSTPQDNKGSEGAVVSEKQSTGSLKNIARPMADPSEDERVLEELAVFIPENYDISWKSSVDLNKDGLKDYIIILTESAFYSDPVDKPAPVLILLRQKDGTLKMHTRNDHVFTNLVLFSSETGETQIQVDSAGGGFALYYYNRDVMGSDPMQDGVWWHFTYNVKKQDFFLTSMNEFSGFIMGLPDHYEQSESTGESTVDGNDTISESEISEFRQDVNKRWKVKNIAFSKFKAQNAELYKISEL